MLLASCGNNLRPLEVDYKVTTKEEYDKDVRESKISRKYSEYQMGELSVKLGSIRCVSICDEIFVPDMTRSELNSTDIPEEFKDTKFITSDEVSPEALIIIKPEMKPEEVFDLLESGTAVQYSKSTTVYPLTDKLKEELKNSKYKFVTIESIYEIIAYG